MLCIALQSGEGHGSCFTEYFTMKGTLHKDLCFGSSKERKREHQLQDRKDAFQE